MAFGAACGILAVAAFLASTAGDPGSEGAGVAPSPRAVGAPPPSPGERAPVAAVAASPTDGPPRFAPSPDDPPRALVRAALEAALAKDDLAPEHLERLTDAVFALRRARSELRGLPPGLEHAARRRALSDAIAAAVDEFVHLTGETPSGLALPGEGAAGLGEWDPTAAEDERPAPVFRVLRRPQPTAP